MNFIRYHFPRNCAKCVNNVFLCKYSTDAQKAINVASPAKATEPVSTSVQESVLPPLTGVDASQSSNAANVNPINASNIINQRVSSNDSNTSTCSVTSPSSDNSTSSTGSTCSSAATNSTIPIPQAIRTDRNANPVDMILNQQSNLFVNYKHLDSTLAEMETSRKSQSFDEVPGPALLRQLSKIWTFIPVLGNQVTASTIQYLLSAGSQLSWGNNLWLYRYLLDEYGPVVRLHGPFGGDVVILSRPEHASIVFQNEGPHPVRSSLDSVEKYRLQYRKYKHAGPFVMFGTEWENLRKIIDDPIQQSGIKQFDKIDRTCDELMVRIMQIRNRQEEVSNIFLNEIYKWSMECLLSVMLNKRLGFLDPRGLSSTSEPAMLLEDLIGATKAIRRCEYGLHLWKFFETPAWRSLVKHCDSIDSILNRHLRKAQDSLRLKKQSDKSIDMSDISLMECLLLKEGMVPEDVLTVLLDMLLLGVNMTAHGVAFMMYHLSRTPRVQQTLYEELGKLPEKATRDTLANLPYLKACLRESLRLKPPMPILSRILTKDIFVHGYKIPKGTYMLLATFLSSIREEHFEDALKFKPERWLGPGVSKEMEVLASIPYGYGPKSCLAKDLAETQINLLIFKLIRRFRIEYHYGDIQSTNRLLAAPDRALKFRFVERL